ncbi:hypothetical protein SEA_WEASELS2_260 [Rhodococcus phage Weasels2]|uniref:Uncharacterized protein n=1 Tax=Rhodococcus phage Weasels2 TaxID=1897437 RepID=A0A1I9SAN2_9CAUD|nr:hypothetical protein FDH04_gp156 [Rhodococcus phage Weasels2]AOZ63838.1 hypothetical protein SEA_WEASELS2_260 [Rhodococcus phage Weasels2]
MKEMKRKPGDPYVQVFTEYVPTKEVLELTIFYGVVSHYKSREDLEIDFPKSLGTGAKRDKVTNRYPWSRSSEEIAKYVKDNFSDLLDFYPNVPDATSFEFNCFGFRIHPKSFDTFPTDSEIDSIAYDAVPQSYDQLQKRYVALAMDIQLWAGRMMERNEWLKRLNETEEV